MVVVGGMGETHEEGTWGKLKRWGGRLEVTCNMQLGKGGGENREHRTSCPLSVPLPLPLSLCSSSGPYPTPPRAADCPEAEDAPEVGRWG